MFWCVLLWGKIHGSDKGLEMFRVAIYWMCQMVADTISKCLLWVHRSGQLSSSWQGSKGNQQPEVEPTWTNTGEKEEVKSPVHSQLWTVSWLLWWTLFLWPQVFLTNIRCFLQAQWCSHPCWDYGRKKHSGLSWDRGQGPGELSL